MIVSLAVLPAARSLPPTRNAGSLCHDLFDLGTAAHSPDLDIECLISLLIAVLNNEPDEVIWNNAYDAVTASTGSTFARPTTPPLTGYALTPSTPRTRNTGTLVNSTEERAYFDGVLKEELEMLYAGVPGFFDAYFGSVPGLELVAQAVFDKCKEGDNPFYQEKSGWKGWPKDALERDVLKWFGPLTSQLLDFAKVYQPASGHRRRPLARPNKSMKGSTARRKLDVGFVDDPTASSETEHHWSQILIPGELKSNPAADTTSAAWVDLGRYVREVLAAQDSRRFVLGFMLCGSLMRLWEFDRVGGITSERFDINKDGLQFVSAVLGFMWLSKEQLGFNPTIITAGDKRYIEIKRDNHIERLIINQGISRVRCIAGRATTCWKAYREGDETRAPLVIKDSWQYSEWEEEGKLLQEATKKDVVNVARYYHHETVRVGGQDDDVLVNVRRGLDIMNAKDYRPESSMPPLSKNGRRVSRTSSRNSDSERKRPLSSTAPLPPTKRTRSSSPTSDRKAIINRVHRRVVVQDYGKAIYKASSPSSLLAALEGCIKGYQSLHEQAGILQSDISLGNLMVNEDVDNKTSWRSFLIDLDIAIKEQREGSSGALGKAGTRAFMAIGVLLDDKNRSFMHDLESFFWVLFWICVHYDGPGKDIGATEFECWNYESDQKLAELKLGLINGERHFLNRITDAFTPYYQPLIPHVNRLRRVVFPMNNTWENEDKTLYSQMKEILRNAQKDLEDLGKSE